MLSNDKDREDYNFKETFKHFLSILSNYKALAIFSLVIVLVLQIANVAEKFMFKGIIDSVNNFGNSSVAKPELISSLTMWLALFCVILFVKVIGAYFRLYFLARLDSKLITYTKQRYFAHILGLSHRFHSEKKTGSLIARLSRGVRGIETINDVLVFSILPLFFGFVVVAASFIYFDLKTGIALFLTSILFIVYSIFIQRKSEKHQVFANRTEDKEKANVNDVFTNVDTIKYFGKERRIINKYNKLSNNTYSAFIKFWDYFNILDAGQNLIIGIGTFFIFYFPIMSIINGTMELGTLAFIYATYLSYIGLLFQFMHGYRGFKRSIVDFNDLYQYSKLENEVKDIPNAQKIRIKNGKISFRAVDFGYQDKKFIQDFNLTIPENSKVAIVGPSGSGKSTLVKLLFRLYDVNKGEIYIDDQDISKVKKESLRNEMSIVPQDAVLFDDTIYNNIKFSNPGASRTQVMKAIKFAQLDKLMKRLPLKENTVVGERGVKLSGGERQRVSIARAILADKKILVLDEATSALDSQIESEIQKDLEKLMVGRTSIIIAHRLSTIMKADIIIVVDKGRIVEAGTHGELLNRGSGLYKTLWGLQAGGFKNK